MAADAAVFLDTDAPEHPSLPSGSASTRGAATDRMGGSRSIGFNVSLGDHLRPGADRPLRDEIASRSEVFRSVHGVPVCPAGGLEQQFKNCSILSAAFVVRQGGALSRH
jgi:hypothetical protein